MSKRRTCLQKSCWVYHAFLYVVLSSVTCSKAWAPHRSSVGTEETDCIDLMPCKVMETLAIFDSPLDLILRACHEVCILLLRLLMYGAPKF